jgi:hypothetical protein
MGAGGGEMVAGSGAPLKPHFEYGEEKWREEKERGQSSGAVSLRERRRGGR